MTPSRKIHRPVPARRPTSSLQRALNQAVPPTRAARVVIDDNSFLRHNSAYCSPVSSSSDKNSASGNNSSNNNNGNKEPQQQQPHHGSHKNHHGLSCVSPVTLSTAATSPTPSVSPLTVASSPGGVGGFRPIIDTTSLKRAAKNRRNNRASPRLAAATCVSPLSIVSSSDATNNSGRNTPASIAKHKTELCLHYASGAVCPYGVDCTYAHGEEELQMTKLWDQHEAGMVDKETFRKLPCWNYVSTGACPFGWRCSDLHDPRVQSGKDDEELSSWLPLTETQGNTMPTDINVESLHQKRTAFIQQGHPLGRDFDMEQDDWADWYKQVCNLDQTANVSTSFSSSKSRTSGTGKSSIPLVVKLQIALAMRGSNPDWHYKYSPQHIICGEQCMLLQKMAFYVDENLQVHPMSVAAYQHNHSRQMLVRELAFGPDSDPSARGVALYFHIRDDQVALCTPQQAKRFRLKKRPPGAATALPTPKVYGALHGMEHFLMVRPHDADGFHLATAILQHRLAVMNANRVKDMGHRHQAMRQLEAQKERLKQRWQGMMRHWKEWQWPVPASRKVVTRKTPVPKVNGEYQVDEECHAKVLWDQFVQTDFTSMAEGHDYDGYGWVDKEWRFDENSPLPLSQVRSTSPAGNNQALLSTTRRLPIFQVLARGESVNPYDQTLPYICNHPLPQPLVPLRAPERCWQALLLPCESNEWEMVHTHFTNARSNKIISMLQKK